MVIGHTPQLDGIKSRCRKYALVKSLWMFDLVDSSKAPTLEGRVVIIDTGISSVYGGRLSALEIFGDSTTALYEKSARITLPRSRPIAPRAVHK